MVSIPVFHILLNTSKIYQTTLSMSHHVSEYDIGEEGDLFKFLEHAVLVVDQVSASLTMIYCGRLCTSFGGQISPRRRRDTAINKNQALDIDEPNAVILTIKTIYLYNFMRS
ncbi:hypothetical protein N665_1135s0003 [Sinapis alba]|nr:hypothetical protein N665_1135s0003 [Sinapis alba]